MRVLHIKSEIAQRELGDLGRGNHTCRKSLVGLDHFHQAIEAGDNVQAVATTRIFRPAERVGFEPTVGKTHNGFRDRPIRPLWHLSNGFSRCGLSVDLH